MNRLIKTGVILSLIVTSGCVPFWRTWLRGEEGAAPRTVVQPHETWCYRTLGQIDCYHLPQRFPPESLVSVDPASRFPLSREDYAKALAEAQKSEK